MKELPIRFSGPMVKAILDGSKTQTRRVVKQDREGLLDCEPTPAWDAFWQCVACPYGKPGDRLWVRETWCKLWPEHQMNDPDAGRYYYAATDDTPTMVDGDGYTDYTKSGHERSPWKPSIHMPRAASRISLDITMVRVERLNDISEADAKSEGIFKCPSGRWEAPLVKSKVGTLCAEVDDPRIAYRALWDQINGPNAWAANPWVWVVEFRRLP